MCPGVAHNKPSGSNSHTTQPCGMDSISCICDLSTHIAETVVQYQPQLHVHMDSMGLALKGVPLHLPEQ